MVVRQSPPELAVRKWLDNKPIDMASSAYGTESQSRYRRWSKKGERFVQVSRPLATAEYSTSMGGLDLVDRMLSFYRMASRNRKWTVCAVLHFFDFLTHGFSIRVTASLWRRNHWSSLTSNCSSVKSWLLRPKHESQVTAKMTTLPHVKSGNCSQMQLWDTMAPSIFQRWWKKHVSRCSRSSRKSKTYVMCMKCKVFLCVSKKGNCFLKYSTK